MGNIITQFCFASCVSIVLASNSSFTYPNKWSVSVQRLFEVNERKFNSTCDPGNVRLTTAHVERNCLKPFVVKFDVESTRLDDVEADIIKVNQFEMEYLQNVVYDANLRVSHGLSIYFTNYWRTLLPSNMHIIKSFAKCPTALSIETNSFMVTSSKEPIGVHTWMGGIAVGFSRSAIVKWLASNVDHISFHMSTRRTATLNENPLILWPDMPCDYISQQHAVNGPSSNKAVETALCLAADHRSQTFSMGTSLLDSLSAFNRGLDSAGKWFATEWGDAVVFDNWQPHAHHEYNPKIERYTADFRLLQAPYYYYAMMMAKVPPGEACLRQEIMKISNCTDADFYGVYNGQIVSNCDSYEHDILDIVSNWPRCKYDVSQISMPALRKCVAEHSVSRATDELVGYLIISSANHHLVLMIGVLAAAMACFRTSIFSGRYKKSKKT